MDSLETARKKALAFRRQVVDKVATLATGAFGLVAALAWNSAIQAVFRRYYGPEGDQVAGLLVYALLVTLIAVLATLWIGRIAGELAGEQEEGEAKA